MPPAVFNSSHLFHTGRDSRQSGSACTDSFNKGIVFVNQVEIGPVEYLIRGLNTMDDFQNFRLGAGLIRGRIVSSLFDRKAGGTVLVDRFGEAVKFAVFGLQADGVTATVHVQPHEQN